VVPASRVLMNLVADIPDRERGIFDLMRPDLVVTRVVLRIFRRIEQASEAEKEATAQSIFDGIESLSSKLLFTNLIGHREGVGHGLVSEQFAIRLEASIRNDTRAGIPVNLEREWNLLGVMWLSAETRQDGEAAVEYVSEPIVAIRLFRESRTDARSQSFDSRATRREPRIAWDILVRIFGTEQAVRTSIAGVRSMLLEDDGATAETVDLVEQYASGWRPARL
jgi:hypothetical protein